MTKILIVEDDELIAEIERDYLEAEGFQVEIALDGKEGLKLALEEEFELLILDIMLPGMNGFEICREVRKVKDVAIIMVTAQKEDIDKIRGLGLGADDYVVKPFSPSELTARVKAHINIHRRLGKKAEKNQEEKESERGAICIQHLRILPLSHQVFDGDREITLPNKEFELLYFLATNPNIVFSKDTLFDRIWGMEALGDTATVAVHVNRLREKIEKDSTNPQILQTVWGAGYRLKL